MKRYIILSLPSYDSGVIVGAVDKLVIFKWLHSDHVAIDTQTGDLYYYDKAWKKDDSLNDEVYVL